jgi:hypothetical protein
MAIETGTPSSTALATTLVASTSTTSAAFGLGNSQSPQGTTDLGTATTSKNPIASQRLIYGYRGQLGSTITYVTTSKTTFAQQQNGVTDSDNGNLHMVLTMAGHQINGFAGALVTDQQGVSANVPLVIYMDGFQVPLSINGAPQFGGSYGDFANPDDGGYYVPADFHPPNLANGNADTKHDYRWRIRVEISLGDPTNTSQPFPLLASDTITGNPGSWTSACLQQGCAAAHVQLIWDSIRYSGGGVPNVTFDVYGKEIYDPRLSPPGLAFSMNPALCLMDFLTDTKFGLSVDPSLIDQDLVIAAANICDEAVVLREGGTEPRYECSGVVDASTQRGDVVQKILDSMAGTLVPPSDVWKMYAGAFTDSILTITDSDLRGPIKIDTAVSRQDLINAVKGTFISDNNSWQSADYPPYVNATYVEDDGGTVTVVDGVTSYTGVTYQDLALDFVTDPVQAQRLAKIKVEEIRHKCPLILPCTMMAFQAEVNDTISFTHARWGLAAATYRVTNTAIVLDDKGKDGPVLGYDIVCVPITSDWYAWDADVDEGTVVICTAPLLPADANVGAPSDLVLESDASTTIIRADGIAHSQILVTWTPPTDATVLDGGYIEIFIEEEGSEYLLAGTAQGASTSFYIDTNITDGVLYNIMVQSLNAAGSHSDGITGSVVCSGSASTISAGSPGPVNVANNDFEASTAIPPADWIVTGSPTLSYDISSEQQGIRSLVVTTSNALDGVYSQSKFEVVPGDMYTGEQYKVGGYMKGDGSSHGFICFRFFDRTNTEISGSAVIADGGTPTPASWNFYSNTGVVPSAAVYGRVYLQNDTTTATSPPTTTAVEFDSVVLIRVASLEDEVVNGPTRGAITAANSSYRPLSNPLTAVDDGISGSPPLDRCEIDIAAFTMRSAIGPTNISINSGVITGLLPSTTYHVYYSDASYAGGAVTYFANTTQAIVLDSESNWYVGSIRTPVTGGLPTIGNNDGGTGAQSGQLYWLSPTLRADIDANNNQTWYACNQPDADGDTSTFFDLLVEDTVWLGGIPSTPSKWSSLQLKIHSSVLSVTAAGAAFLDYSLDDGSTWTNIYNVVYGSDSIEFATAGANSGGAGTAWTNPANIVSPTSYATLTSVAHGLTSQSVQATGLGFSLATGSTIDGITVNFDEIDGGTAEPLEQGQFQVQLLKAGTPVGTPKIVNGQGTTTLQLGNNTDLWGATWGVSDINNSGFGVEIAAVTPSALGTWGASTYYSPLGMMIDSNGNFQVVVTPGTSAATHPTWATTPLGQTTTDGTVVWALYQLASTWSAGQVWNPGNPNIPTGPTNVPHFITATAGGVSCVFELTSGTQQMPQLGNITAYIWTTSTKGAFDKAYPLGNPPSANAVNTNVNSLHWYTNVLPWANNSSTYDVYWDQVNGDGSLGPNFDMLFNQGWEALVVGQIYFPRAGVYNFILDHDDGAMIAFDPSMCKKVGGTVTNDAWSSNSPSLGYPWMAGNNNSGSRQDSFSINVTTAGSVIEFELGYINWEHAGHLILTCADSTGTYRDLIPTSTSLKTGTTTPTWPAWTTSLAPYWASVSDASGSLVWVNRGPVTDFQWAASTPYTAAATTITDSNGDKETPYRAGKSGTTHPTWNTTISTTASGQTADSTSLVWDNVGGYTSATSFNFSVRNANIDVSYLPPTAQNTRTATTDEITLALNQNLSLIQVRYGLTLGGEIRMYEVWVEALAG